MQGLVLRCSGGSLSFLVVLMPPQEPSRSGAGGSLGLTVWSGEMARGTFPWLGLSLLRVQPLPRADGNEGVTTAAGLTEQALTQPYLYILIYFLTRLQGKWLKRWREAFDAMAWGQMVNRKVMRCPVLWECQLPSCTAKGLTGFPHCRQVTGAGCFHGKPPFLPWPLRSPVFCTLLWPFASCLLPHLPSTFPSVTSLYLVKYPKPDLDYSWVFCESEHTFSFSKSWTTSWYNSISMGTPF